MTAFTFINGATSLLASDILSTDTAIYVTEGEGDKFPSPVAPIEARLALEDNGGNIEYVSLTSRVGDMLNIVRAREGSIARDYAVADQSRIELRLTAETQATIDLGVF